MRTPTSNTVESLGMPLMRPRWGPLRGLLRTMRKNPVGAVSGVIVLVFVFMAAFPGVVAPYNPLQYHAKDALQPPSLRYPLGTDPIGRDMLSRMIHGSRIAMIVGVGTVFLGAAIGSLIGLAAGYWGRWLDMALQYIIDAFLSIPTILLALALVSILKPGIQSTIIAIAVTLWPTFARVVRAETLSVKQNQYVDAARAIGVSDLRIILRHIFPNLFATILVMATLWVGVAVIVEAILSFLGVGIQPPAPSWGRMLSVDGLQYFEIAPWLAIVPGLFLVVLVFSISLLGDTIRDITDPRLRGSV
ncbi:MAG: ABC transporter permease [Chloroflexi bacterium]|nr:ABC transporter permease [Chloroflexota bacterium]